MQRPALVFTCAYDSQFIYNTHAYIHVHSYRLIDMCVKLSIYIYYSTTIWGNLSAQTGQRKAFYYNKGERGY